jgi:glycosyltransferase involved in cell wall biosynthesis
VLQPCEKIALIPAYEPSETLLELLRELNDAHFGIVLVDDGSGEKYRRIFSEAGRFGKVLVHDTNLGKGKALKTGLAFISRHCSESSVVVTLDADGQHRVPDVLKVADAALNSPGALVLGCRRFCGNVPARSRFGNSVTRFVYRLATGSGVHDTQTGLRAFTSEMIPFMLNVSGERYEYEMNVLLKCSTKKVPIKEVEIATIYIDGNSGSHFNAIKDSLRIYRDIFRFAASSLTGFAVDYGVYSLLLVSTKSLGSAVSLPLSNISARIVSSGVNYSLNRRFVFKSEDSVVKTAAQYFALAGCILAGNTLLLSVFVNYAGINEYAAKILTELTFFFVSWAVQKFVIFRKKPEKAESDVKGCREINGKN